MTSKVIVIEKREESEPLQNKEAMYRFKIGCFSEITEWHESDGGRNVVKFVRWNS